MKLDRHTYKGGGRKRPTPPPIELDLFEERRHLDSVPAAPLDATPAELDSAAALVGRRSAQCRAILARLRAGPVTNSELADAYGLRYGARIYDLRQLGYRIATERARHPHGLVRYRLVGEP